MSMPPDDSRRGMGPRQPGTPPRGNPRVRAILVAVGVLIVSVLVLRHLDAGPPVTNMSYSTFLTEAAAHEVKTASIQNSTGTITGVLSSGAHYSTTGPQPALGTDISALRADNVVVTFSNPSGLSGLIIEIVIILLITGLFFYFFTRSARNQMAGMMSIGRSRARLFTEDRPTTTFADVAGYDGVKQEISEVVEFLKTPGRYREIGATIPKGVLLVGPPGTGKTLFARAVAGEAGVPFLSVSGSDFMEMFVGVGASRVRDLFQTARKQAPAIIFIDEIDSIGRKRGAGLGGGHDEREQTLNQLLSEMDGFDSSEGVVLLAATNRPDVLDQALLRPGRFDRQIVVPLPDFEERLPILKVHVRNKRLGTDVDLSMVARGTPGMSGADLANLVNEAALHAVRRGATTIAMEDFETARDRVLMGQKRDAVLLREDERRRIAYHESGHALLAYVLDHSDPLHKITIIPRGMALGVTMTLPEDDRHIYSREQLEDSLCMRMGGRVAELLVYGDLSTGASDDLQRNTELARRMVREWGMSKEIGPMAWGTNDQVFLGEDLIHTRDYSDDTSKVIDDEVERILREQEARAIEVLTLHRRGLTALAESLLEHETIDGETAARLIDEAHGEPVHPNGDKTVSSLRPVTRTDGGPEPSVTASTWAPPSLPPT